LKDRWNEEVEGAVRWIQGTDWDGVRADVEGGLSRALGSLMGRNDAGQVVEDVKGRVADAGRAAVYRTQEVAAQTRDSVVDGSMKAVDRASRAAVEAKNSVVGTAGEARNIAAQKSGEAKAETKGFLARGMEKGKQMVGLAQEAAGRAGEQVGKAADGALPGMQSDVEKALRQRYERRDGDLSRSVSEVLQERYRPMDKRDNTVLRGI
jgi:MICOS complex subunit MIC12